MTVRDRKEIVQIIHAKIRLFINIQRDSHLLLILGEGEKN
jgi:hypothetical protein